jgi:hypothetical protein
MFVSVLDGSAYAADVFDDERGKVVTTPIAYCENTDRIVSVDCRLSPGCNNFGKFWEFSFAITVTSLDGDEPPFETMNRGIALNYIPHQTRLCVMEIVCAALRALLAHVNPARIYRVTKMCRPPAKALLKHHLLTDVLVACGYAVARSGTDRWGRLFWLCERSDS